MLAVNKYPIYNIMSQSDITARKRVRAQLATQSKLPSILSSQLYTSFVQFTQETGAVLPNAVNVKSTTYNDLTYPGQYKVFNVPEILAVDPNTTCPPKFEICANTNARLNRRPTNRPLFSLDLGYNPTKQAEEERAKEKRDQAEREERRRRAETRKEQQVHSGKYCC